MEVRVLRYFLTVAKEQNITRAAEVLHITQPTLSRQLAQMEDDLGVALFERGGKKIRLTNEGILLRRRAEEIVSLVDKTEKELLEQEKEIDGMITIGCGEIAAVEVLAKLLASFHEKYPKVQFDLFTGNADLVKEQMDQGLIDIGLLLEPVDIDKYDYVRTGVQERWVVLMRPDDPLAEKERITASDLEGKPLILPRRAGVRGGLAGWFGDRFEQIQLFATLNLSGNGVMLVRNGMGYALVVEGSVPFLDQRQVAARPIYPELHATSVLAWKRGQPFSPAVGKFIAHIQCLTSIEKHSEQV